jgi:hypothetical protein
LIYPPDLDRFLKYLSDSVRSAINYLHALAEALGESVEMLDPAKQNLEHWIIAAKTKFQFIKK